MSLERMRQELNDAHEHRRDLLRTLIHMRLVLFEVVEYLENQSLEKENAAE